MALCACSTPHRLTNRTATQGVLDSQITWSLLSRKLAAQRTIVHLMSRDEKALFSVAAIMVFWQHATQVLATGAEASTPMIRGGVPPRIHPLHKQIRRSCFAASSCGQCGGSGKPETVISPSHHAVQWEVAPEVVNQLPPPVFSPQEGHVVSCS